MILTWRYALQSLSLVLPHLQTSQQSLSVTFSIQTHNRCCPKLSNTLYQSYRVHGALLLGCVGVGCSRMALVGCTQMATDTTGLLQRMLPRLDATHLAVCIAVSKPFETSPENRNHSQAFGCCQPCLPCINDWVGPTPPPDVPKDIDGDGRKEEHEHHQRHVQDGACGRVYEGGCLRCKLDPCSLWGA